MFCNSEVADLLNAPKISTAIGSKVKVFDKAQLPVLPRKLEESWQTECPKPSKDQCIKVIPSRRLPSCCHSPESSLTAGTPVPQVVRCTMSFIIWCLTVIIIILILFFYPWYLVPKGLEIKISKTVSRCAIVGWRGQCVQSKMSGRVRWR